ncbi:RNA-binding protein YlmH [Enterococcus sp. PF1-24]|uniref:YlmH family RNA-binding protein n=1 Tax=unclassified Enterococcus TaxID=2608891 RepID=UPI00247723D7|nr:MULTISPECIES: RNA-binding protein [unclassified Enterococcus]MDH6364451.1 RNA-binding protein YlmH [Enterococcus sp. PFB1-1]MDH6401526.1 RNA-binding protein YlmH [Enterococcus sp. PF1-24]
MNVNVYQHFRADEHPFIDAVGDWIEKVDSQYAPYLTDFLDPRQAYIVETLVRQMSELKFQFYGGYPEAERSRCLIFPDYYQATEADFEIVSYEVMYPQKFSTLGHGKILGTLLGAGIRRDAFGDIVTDGLRWQVFMTKEISSFIANQVNKVGNVSVRFEEMADGEFLQSVDKWQEETTTVSSLRLDTVVASVYNISRQRAKQLIESGKVKVNWGEVQRTDFILAELDIISVRGFGRIQLLEINGKTKKDKLRLVIGVLRK